MIADYMGKRSFAAGEEVIIPVRPWNPAGVDASGYQLVPILCYHNLDRQAKGRLVLAASSFEEQMRYLKREGITSSASGVRRVHELQAAAAAEVGGADVRRRLPRVQGIRLSRPQGAGLHRHALRLHRLRRRGAERVLVGRPRGLGTEGFDIQAHSKTHADLRRAPNETDAQFTRRMQVELEQPLAMFQQRIGSGRTIWPIPTGGRTTRSSRRPRSTATSRPSRCAVRAAPPSSRRSRASGARSTPR